MSGEKRLMALHVIPTMQVTRPLNASELGLAWREDVYCIAQHVLRLGRLLQQPA